MRRRDSDANFVLFFTFVSLVAGALVGVMFWVIIILVEWVTSK